MMKNKIHRPVKVFIFVCGLMTLWACSSEKSSQYEHYFLDGYDHLEFRDRAGEPVRAARFIGSVRYNGVHGYRVRDSTLVLVHKRTGEPYTGFIRTFHHNLNLQGEFEDGKMFRLRFWHPNRTLGMDMDFRSKTSSIWSASGQIMVKRNADETYYYYPDKEVVKEIIADTMRSFYNREGELTGYTVEKDSFVMYYFADGSPRLRLPYDSSGSMNGPVKRWHSNGTVQATGQYENDKQVGLWIEYDREGNEIHREVFTP